MATLLFAWELGAGLGHVTVIRPLAERLLQLGHRVVVAARDVNAAAHTLGSLDIPLLQAPVHLDPVARPVVPPSTFADTLHNAGLATPRNALGPLTAWRSFYDLIAPDAVLFDHAPLALLAASDRSFRKVMLGTGFTCPPALDQFPDWRQHDRPEPDPHVHDSEHVVLTVANQYRSQLGAPALARLSQLFTDTDLTLLTTVRELDHFPDRKSATYFGNWVSGDVGATPSWPEGPGKRLFAYLKPYRELPYLLNLLATSRCPTVAYIANCPPTLLEVRCPSVSIQTDPVALDHAAQNCDAAILHAGHGSTLQFLLHGKPLLLLPLVLEQRFTAQHVESLGAGLCVNPHDKESLKAELTAFLTQDALGKGARSFAERYVDMHPREQCERAARAVHELVGRG